MIYTGMVGESCTRSKMGPNQAKFQTVKASQQKLFLKQECCKSMEQMEENNVTGRLFKNMTFWRSYRHLKIGAFLAFVRLC
jgi:hypothetical protein